MKKYLIASSICIFPLFVISIAIPVVNFAILMKESRINETVFWWSIIILCVCLSVILTTILLMLKYGNVIDDLDRERQRLYDKDKDLSVLINKYNQLLTLQK